MSTLRTIGLGTVTGFVAQFFALVVGIITVPLLVKSLGVSAYGFLGVISSLVGFVGIADLGMTSTVTNAISYARTRNDTAQMNRLWSGAFLIYGPLVLAIIVLAGFLLKLPSVDINSLLSLEGSLRNDAKLIILIMVSYTALGMFCGGILKSILHGNNEVHIYNVTQTIYAFVFGVLFVMYLLFGSVTLLGVVLLQAGGMIVRLLTIYVVAKKRYKWLVFVFSKASIRAVTPLLRYSLELFVTVLAAIILARSDNVVLSHYLGVAAVAVYSIAYKLFQLPSNMLPIATASLPTVAGLYEKKDWKQLRTLYGQIVQVNVITKFIIFSLLGVFSFDIVMLWVGADLYAGVLTIAALGFGHLLFAWYGSHVLFLNAMFAYRANLIPSIISTILNLGFSIYLVKRIGMAGVAIGTIIAFLLTVVWYVPFYVRMRIGVRPLQQAWKLIKCTVPAFVVFLASYAFLIVPLEFSFARVSLSIFVAVLFVLLVTRTSFSATQRRYVYHLIKVRFTEAI